MIKKLINQDLKLDQDWTKITKIIEIKAKKIE